MSSSPYEEAMLAVTQCRVGDPEGIERLVQLIKRMNEQSMQEALAAVRREVPREFYDPALERYEAWCDSLGRNNTL